MTLEEAIEHCKQKADELSICNKDCSLEHKQLAIWLSELKAIKEKYEKTNSTNNMKQYIIRTICAILLSPILVIMLIGYIPFAIFKGLTDSFTFNEYFLFVERITDSLLHPITRWQDRKNRYEELKRTSEWYRKENKRLNDILDNNIQNNKSCKQ